jgi:hypothetical protein
MRRTPVILFITIVFCVAALFYVPERLTLARLPGGLPLGTLFAIVALIAGVALTFILSRPYTVLRWVSTLALIVTLLWFPIGLYLAGNVGLNFVNDPGRSALFRQITVGTTPFVLGGLGWTVASFVMNRATCAA